MAKTLLLVCLFFLVSARSLAQKPPIPELDIDDFIQQLFAVQDDDLNYEDAYETLYQLFTTPLDLNRATRNDLKSLYLLSEAQIDNFFKHKEKQGDLLTLYELQAIETFDLQTINKILPFVTLQNFALNADNTPLWKRIISEENNFLLLRSERTLETKRGFLPLQQGDTSAQGVPLTRYEGSPNKLYLRWRVSHAQDFSIGFTAEKDAGEAVVWNPSKKQYGFDFMSFHAAFYNRGRWKSIIVGDYQVQIGQGLLSAAGFYIGKGAEAVATVRRSSLGIRPYTSVVEANYFRGAAATYQLDKLTVTPFVSFLAQSANLQTFEGDTLEAVDDFANAIVATGFHRTAREIASKNQINNLTGGLNALWQSRSKNLEIGVAGIYTRFSSPLLPADRLYNRFDFRGIQNYNLSFYYNYQFQNLNLFGEVARSQSGGTGAVLGLLASLSASTELAVLYRRYDRNFHTFYGAAFSEGTRNINENGFYWGLKIKPSRKITMAAYFDLFRFDWLKFLVDAPSTGYEYLLRFTYQPSKTISIYAQFREENKGKNLKSEFQIQKNDVVVQSTKRNILMNVDVRVDKLLTWRSRVQFSTYEQQSGGFSTGYVIVQDATFDVKAFKFSTRFAFFDTQDYDNRQYVFEKDVLYAFSIPAYYGRGFRNYYLLQIPIGKKIDIWLRYALTLYRNQQTISSGLETINGNQKTDVKFQIRYIF